MFLTESEINIARIGDESAREVVIGQSDMCVIQISGSHK